MNKDERFEINIEKGIRIVARFLGGTLFLMTAVFALSEGLPNPLALDLRQELTLISIVIMLVGLILAWKLEGIGGIVILIGYLVFAIINPKTVAFGVILLFPLTGALFIICWWRSRNTEQPS